MNLQDVGSETSVNDSVQTNKMINKRQRLPKGLPKMDDIEKLATLGTQEEEK
jgi:hypothetical protein